jgi:GT2 family glycosyltransferase
MNKITFIILHYCAIQETIECVNSIKNKIDTENYEILIVDNCSPNGSGEQLVELYKNDIKITILQNKENLGFARGNNVGFRYAKNKCQTDFIVLLNSDTILLSDDFFEVVLNEYKKSRFAVLGPHIITPYKDYDNPGRDSVITLYQLNKYVLLVRIRLCLNYLHLECIYNKFLGCFKKTANIKNNIDRTQVRCENVQLHGCCLIFSPLYIKQSNGLDDRTFLYREEDILYAQMMKKGLKTVYNPAIRIYHKEGKSTGVIKQATSKRRRFKYKNLLHSSKVLKNIILNKDNSI